MIFNKSNNGQEEVKAILGFTHLSLNFDNLKTYIDIATAELQEDLIGSGTYNLAEEHYLSSNYEKNSSESGSGEESGSGSGRTNKDLDNLVHAIQRPIIYAAYRNFANSGDLQHTNHGRQITVSETQKPAFEWQLERDDRNLVQTQHKLQDLLLKYLEDNIGIYPEFRNSEAYSVAKSCFINTTKDFDDVFHIEKSRRLFIVLSRFMREIEEKTFKPILSDQYATLKAAILANNLTADQRELLSYIKPPLVLLTIGTALTRLPVNVMPDGIYQNYINESASMAPRKAADSDARNLVASKILEAANNELNRLNEYLQKTTQGSNYTPTDLNARHSSDNKFMRC